jgi:hypothetical protein
MSIIALLITLIIWGLIFWLLWWALGAVGIPEPFHKVAVVILVIAAVVVVIGILTGGIAPFTFLNSLILK